MLNREHPLVKAAKFCSTRGHTLFGHSLIIASTKALKLGGWRRENIDNVIDDAKMMRIGSSHLAFRNDIADAASIVLWLEKHAAIPGPLPLGPPPAGSNRCQGAAWRALAASGGGALTGGPGTGKSWLTARLAGRLHELGYRTICVAPTGKAASNLREKLADHGCNQVKVDTIHSAVEIDTERGLAQRCADDPLPYQAIIVDEAGSVSTSLLARLVDAIVPGRARLILVGDKNQLPPVGAGFPFRDITETPYAAQKLGFPTCRLQTLTRQAFGSAIPMLAKGIVRGELDTALLKNAEDVRHFNFSGWEVADRLATLWCSEYLSDMEPSAEGRLIVSPTRRLAIASSAGKINKSIQQRLGGSRATEKFHCGDKVVATSNRMYQSTGVYNGMFGFVLDANTVVGLDSVRRSLPNRMIDDIFDLGYATTIHKAQGSEAGTVVVVCDGPAHMMNRNLLYTAVTRAKRNLIIVGRLDAMRKACANRTVRDTILWRLLAQREKFDVEQLLTEAAGSGKSADFFWDQYS